MMRSLFRTVLLLAFSFSLSSAVQSQAIRTIALSDQHAPGTPNGVRFDGFSVPLLGADGRVVFTAGLTGNGIIYSSNGGSNSSGIWTGDAGSLAMAVRAGDQAAGLPTGVRFGNFSDNDYHLAFSSNGQVAFWSGLVGPGIDDTNGSGWWAGAVGSINLVLGISDHPPGTPPAVSFLGDPGSFKINSAGQMMFSQRLATYNDSNNDGIWSTSGGALALVARDGDHAPGLPADVVFDDRTGAPQLNPSGHVVFSSLLTGGGIDFGNNGSVWSDRSGSLALVARGDDPAPGAPSGVVFRGFYEPALDAAGHVAFDGWLAGPGVTEEYDTGIWSDVGGSLSLVVLAGDHAPGFAGDVRLTAFEGLAMNNTGTIAFSADLVGSGIDFQNQYSIWSNSSGSLQLVARSGDSAPGINGKVWRVGDLMLNDAGQVAFTALLTNPGELFTGNYSLWAEDKAGIPRLIVRQGGQIEVAPGDFRTVRSFSYRHDVDINGDNSSYLFNGRGQFAFLANFTDGTQGIFVSDVATVPEPSAVALLASAAIALFASQRRFRGRLSRQPVSV
jgi:hypothetical protein